MSAVELFWSDPSFRRAIRKLLSLRTEQLATLAEITRPGFELSPQEARKLGLSDSDATSVLAAVRAIYDAGRDSSYNPEESLREIESLLETESVSTEFREGVPDEKRDSLLALLARRPDYDRKRERRRIETIPLPVFQHADFYVDLRSVNTETESGERVRFVPILLARIFTDESAAGPPLIFQLTRDSVERLKKDIESAERLLKTVERQVSDSLY